MNSCPACRIEVPHASNFCPNCGITVNRTCPYCHHMLSMPGERLSPLDSNRFILAQVYLGLEKYQLALDELNRLLKLRPADQDLLALKSQLELRMRGSSPQGGLPGLATAGALASSGSSVGVASKATCSSRVQVATAPLPCPDPPHSSATGAPASETGTPVSLPPSETGRTPRLADHLGLATATPRPNRQRLKYTVALFGALIIGLIGYIFYTWRAGLRQLAINEHLKIADTAFKEDSLRGYKTALENYQAILDIDAEHPQALARAAFSIAVYVGELGGPTELLAEAGRYLAESRKDPNPGLAAARGLVWLYGGENSSEAVKTLLEGLKAFPNSVMLNAALGTVLSARGEFEAARKHFSAGAARMDIRSLSGLGLMALRSADYREAAQTFRKVLQVNHHHDRSMVNLGLVELLRGSGPGLTLSARKALAQFMEGSAQHASEGCQSKARLIELVLKIRDPQTRDTGLSELLAFLPEHPDSATLQFIASRELRLLGRLGDAGDAIDRALKMDASRPNYLLEQAATLLAQKDYEGSRSKALKVGQLAAGKGLKGQSQLIVADTYLGEKKFGKAAEHYLQARNFEDTEAISHFRLGQLYLLQPNMDSDKAQAQLELAVPGLLTSGMRRAASEAGIALAKLYARKNLGEKFGLVMEKINEADPTYGPSYCLMAANIRRDTIEGRTEAKRLCKHCVQLGPEGAHTTVCNRLLKRGLALNSRAGKMSLFRKVVSRSP